VRFSPALTVEKRSVYLLNAVLHTECGSTVRGSRRRHACAQSSRPSLGSGRKDFARWVGVAIKRDKRLTSTFDNRRLPDVRYSGERWIRDVSRGRTRARLPTSSAFRTATRFRRGDYPAAEINARFPSHSVCRDSTRGDLIARRLWRTRNALSQLTRTFWRRSGIRIPTRSALELKDIWLARLSRGEISSA